MTQLAIQKSAVTYLGDVIGALLDQALVNLGTDLDTVRHCLLHAEQLLGVNAPAPSTGGLAPWQVKRARTFIDAHLAGPLRLSALAGEVRLSVSHFGRSFRKSFNETFVQYVTRMRVKRAQQMMAATNVNLCEIGLACGFADQAHFSRVFGRYIGVTPSKWRRHHALRLSDIQTGRAARDAVSSLNEDPDNGETWQPVSIYQW
jgi:AraC family transcriptional regulator